MTKLLNKLNTGTEDEPAQPGPTGYVPNLMEEARWMDKAGVGFGEEGTYLVFKSLQAFSILKQVKELKFLGKILCLETDYYIAESPGQPGQEELPPEVEPKGTGINKMTYWVTTDLHQEWKELPVITPQQLTSARKIKYKFTGNLDRNIITNPHFPGKESHLLKCQLVLPRTMFTVNADDKKQIDPTQEWKIPTFKFLCSMENWVHHHQNILKNGRLTLLKPQIPQDGDEQKLMKELQAQDPFEDRLKPITVDIGKGKQPAWALRIFGDTNEYRAMSKEKSFVNNGYISLKSLIWKGWTMIYHDKQWISMYVGNGMKSIDDWYYPKFPEQVCSECKDFQQQPQPNFPPEEDKKPQESENIEEVQE